MNNHFRLFSFGQNKFCTPAKVLFFIILLTLSFTTQAARHALVIGNQDYEVKPLYNPENDARDMSNALKKLDFKVTLLINANKPEIIKQVRRFANNLSNGDVALFYFSGHGVQIRRSNYLVPLGSRVYSDVDAEYEFYDAQRVLAEMKRTNSRGVNIMILDACRDNPFKSLSKSFGSGLAKMDAPTGSLIAYATAPNTVAWGDSRERNSIYTKHLLNALQTKVHLSILDLLTEVAGEVYRDTNGQQTPWKHDSLIGRFCLNGCGNAKPQLTDLQIIKQLEQEIGKTLEKLEKVEWDSVGYVMNAQNQITELGLYKCDIEQIPEGLTDLIYLQKLFFSDNKIKKLPAWFGQLQNLSVLNLGDNQLKELPASFGQLQNLKELDLNSNQLRELPASFGQLQNLRELDLNSNQLQELPVWFGQLQNLSRLDLDKNQLKELPASFGQLQNLSELYLWNNRLKELPASFGQLKNLSRLDLENTQLKELPAWFGQLQNLSRLSLSDNQLKELPESFGQLQNLNELWLQNNQLKALPASFGQLQNLSWLELEKNQLKELPASFGQLKNSCRLYIRNNPLETPPMEIAKQGIPAIRNYFRNR
jgi:Leucine-rich repeat (LRR) protein